MFKRCMTHVSLALAAFSAMTMMTMAPAWADDLDEITIAYFLEWPAPNLMYKADGTFEKDMGVKVNWRAFGNGNEMSAAMASGDVQIAYSQGLVPFVIAVTNGLPLKAVGIAASYAENDNCIVRDDAGITKDNAQDLIGKKVATPIGNVTHYKLLATLRHLKVDADKVDIVPMNPQDGAAALARGDVVMSCGFGGALQRMKEFGKPLMTAKEQEAIGIRVFDFVSTTDSFASEHPEIVEKFLKLTAEANGKVAGDREKYLPILAKEAGIDMPLARQMSNLFKFPTLEEQVSDQWLGGTVQEFIRQIAKFYVDQGELSEVLDDYGPTIDTTYLKAAE